MFNLEDLAGLGKSIDKILDVIARGTGILYEPTKIRRAAEAEAYKIKLIADAQANKHKTQVEAKVEERFIVEKANLNFKSCYLFFYSNMEKILEFLNLLPKDFIKFYH